MGNVEPSESSEPPEQKHGGRPRLRRGLYGTGAGICAAAAVLSLVALSGGHPSSAAPKDAAAQGRLNKAAALAAKPAAAAPAAPAAKAAAPVAPAANPAAAPASGNTVMIMNYAYSPASLTVAPGGTVTWTNMDTAPHTVTVSSGPVKFNSPTLQKGDTFTYTFTKPGTYQYYCAVHPDMKASVTVTGSTTTPTPTPTPTTSAPTTPTPTPTTSSPSPSQECAVSSALQTFLTHLNAAHLSESPGQQVQDILDLDNYLKMHMALIENMLAPLTNGGLTDILSTDLTTIFTHIETAHLEESPTQQLQDILNIDQYLKMHMAWIESLIAPIAAQTC